MYIFDAGPLSSFALVERLDVLARRYTETAAWTIEVRAEVARGIRSDSRLEALLHQSWLPEPIILGEVQDLVKIERFRWALGGSDTDLEKHRGEAATLVAAEIHAGIAVIDDHDARRLALANQIPVIGTVGILESAVQANELTPIEAAECIESMREEGRRLPAWVDEGHFSEM